MITVTLSFNSIAEAIAALGSMQTPTTIAHNDRPDVGHDFPTITMHSLSNDEVRISAYPDPAVVFGAAAQAPTPVVTITPVDPAPVEAAPAATEAAPTVMEAAPADPPAAPVPTKDSRGMVWDARIHGESKNLNKDGTWRRRKNLDPEFLQKVEAELLGAPTAPTPPTAEVAAVAAPAPSVPPSPPAPPADAPPAPAAAPTTFAELMAAMSPGFAADPAGMTARTTAVLNTLGLSAMGQLAARPDLIPQVWAGLSS